MTQTCKQHHHADDVVPRYLMDGLWEFTCDRNDHVPPGPRKWTNFNEPGRGGEPPKRSLNSMAGPLLKCLLPGESWVEYGVVEWRFRAVAPALFKEMVEEDGHVWLNPRSSKGWTASAYLVHALGELRDREQADAIFNEVTEPGRKQSEVTYWALRPTPPTTARLTFAEFAAAEGITDDMMRKL